MSRVGSSVIKVDSKNAVDIFENYLEVKNSDKTYRYNFDSRLICKKAVDGLVFEINNLLITNKSLLRYVQKIHGFHVRDLQNFLTGLVVPFKKVIEVIGTGYKVLHNKNLNYLSFNIGYSHDIIILIPDGLKAEVVQNKVNLSSSSKATLGAFSAYLTKSLRKFDKFKGKGVVCVGDYQIRKELKKK